ncbi:hypothetical protein BJ912DRAFT_447515 [Pholiota molesta]|nr:hypothetical protein BJ912DRAFT_447515 [Pholiota molesta]
MILFLKILTFSGNRPNNVDENSAHVRIQMSAHHTPSYHIKVYAVAIDIFLCDSRSLHLLISSEPIFDRNERFEYETSHSCDRMRHIIGTRGKPTAYFPRLRSTARNGRRGDVFLLRPGLLASYRMFASRFACMIIYAALTSPSSFGISRMVKTFVGTSTQTSVFRF